MVTSKPDEKTNADPDPTSTPGLVTQKAEDHGSIIRMAEQRERPAVLKTDDESTAQQIVEEKFEPIVEKPKQAQTDTLTSGKENLLNILGNMKVEVTNKRMLKTLKAKPNFHSAPQAKPADMESTISMFQKATVKSSLQRSVSRFKFVACVILHSEI